MKILMTILTVLLVLVLLLGAGLQVFLTKGLTTALNEGVFPAVQSMYGLELAADSASVNLLKGRAELNGFTVRNLKGYEAPYLLAFDECLLEVDLLSLLKRDPVVIKRAEAIGATLTVERNRERNFNVMELAQALKPVESAEAPAEPAPAVEQPAPATEPAAPVEQPAPEREPAPEAVAREPVPVHIRRVIVDTVLHYVDSRDNRDYALKLRLSASDLFTMPEAGQPDSLVVLRGSLADDAGSFVTDLNAVVEPLTDPRNPSFSATGSILDIDAAFLRDTLEKNDMQSGPFSVRPSITCSNGYLQGSSLDFVLSDLKIFDTSIGDTTLPVSLYGRIEQPRFDITSALTKLFSKHGEQIGKALFQRELKKELGIDTQAAPGENLMNQLTNRVEEIEESPALQELIQQIVPGTQPTNTTSTNKPLGETLGDAVYEQLEKNVKELEGNEAVKELFKGLFK